ncbi:DUF4065 domain-containing protein [Corynebacterium sp. c8Ua_181]|uniref:DUF4065 domain-containing protein n=1 Tax=Corynebacterium curieae TaxID=2913500 RepID=A0A9X3RSV5_9CORY|nr:type II toxin-antitoxin system antitoxin SocA domain-containing protein [Corynebacterium curieae]MCZ9306396.1 DUF4065 domain-containing protein [Corynebacterium curieae]MDV2423161.1 DUF4065 domain-containing protein [Corynebacterium curieae]
MATAVDVAQVIYNKLGWVDSWKLEKLTYYCQAWSLGWYGRPLVSNEFQAWTDGPVEPNLYRENKYQRSEKTSTVLPGADAEAIGDEAEKIIDAVIAFYGDKTSNELIELTHSERPWIAARGQMGPEVKTNEPISQLEMKKYYALQEARGVEGPTRPVLSVQNLSGAELKQRLQASAERWKGALEILATR